MTDEEIEDYKKEIEELRKQLEQDAKENIYISGVYNK